MNITVLDGNTLNPGDLTWEGFENIGNLTVYDLTPESMVVERGRDSEVLITNKTKITREILKNLPKLRYIGILATGYNVVDTEAAAEAGVTVCNIPAYSTMSVAQHIFSLILALTNMSEYYSIQNKAGRWECCKDFSYADFPLIELAGKRMGIVGYGNIGQATAKIAKAFGMEVSVLSSKPQSELDGVKKESLEDLFRNCDVIALCCPLTPENSGMVNVDLISLMKPTAILINTSRGGLVNEKDLADALNSGKIYGAGVDVLSCEPPKQDNPLLRARNCIVTQHIAWATKEARERCMQIAVSNLESYLAGKPVNVVAAPVLP